jgi:hypothetical protein
LHEEVYVDLLVDADESGLDMVMERLPDITSMLKCVLCVTKIAGSRIKLKRALAELRGQQDSAKPNSISPLGSQNSTSDSFKTEEGWCALSLWNVTLFRTRFQEKIAVCEFEDFFVKERVRKAKQHGKPLDQQPSSMDKESVDELSKELSEIVRHNAENGNTYDQWLIKESELEYTKKLGSGTSAKVYKGLFKNKKVPASDFAT